MNSYLCMSVTGGGILGVGPAHYISRLETDLGFPLHKKLVGQAGTSTGSIIAAAMAEGLKGSVIEDLYKKKGKDIFTKYSVIKRMGAKCPTYNNENLKKILQSKFKGKLKDWGEPIFITTTFMNGKSVEKVWDPGDDVDKWFSVLTSCSAPTYFDVIVDEEHRSFCDGGLWANSCPDILMAGMFRRGFRDIRILNLETGMDAPNTDCGNKSLAGWGLYFINKWIGRASRAPAFVVSAVLGDENFFNVLPKIKKPFDMDKVSVIDDVIEIWDKQYDNDREKLLKFVNP